MKELDDLVAEALMRLTPREEQILRLRFAIGECKPSTLKAIGERFDVSPERIRQIEKKALRKLRWPIVPRTYDEAFK